MRKRITAILFTLSLLAACQSSRLDFHEVENIPDDVQANVDQQKELQSIQDDKGTYIIFQSDGDVKADVDIEDDTVSIDFNVSDSPGDGIKQNTYYFAKDEKHDSIDISVDGESTYLDESTV